MSLFGLCVVLILLPLKHHVVTYCYRLVVCLHISLNQDLITAYFCNNIRVVEIIYLFLFRKSC